MQLERRGRAVMSSSDDPATGQRYLRSMQLLRRAEAVIPLGSQTFSKSHLQYPAAQSPMFLSHGLGGHVFDVDGNEYIDLVGGLLPLVLGYRDPDVDAAISEQMGRGITFSLATELEIELAELLRACIPSAEMVRFGKNGTDATSAAIRLARAHTGRDHVIACGYHGWQDWYIGATTRNLGVPKAVQELTHLVPYNDLDSVRNALHAHSGEVAALIMEPMNTVPPVPGYLHELKELVHQHGALLIYDEIITGFRFHIGGAQRHFGVTPDLSAFGKAMGNGMPISAVVGRAEIMRLMEEIFYSGTFAGETLSLAAAVAVIRKMQEQDVIGRLWQLGDMLASQFEQITEDVGLQDVVALAGLPPWKILVFSDHPAARKEAVRTLFLREMMQRGILVNASHNVCFAHDEQDVACVAAAYREVLPLIARELDTGRLEARLGVPAVEPVFRVR